MKSPRRRLNEMCCASHSGAFRSVTAATGGGRYIALGGDARGRGCEKGFSHQRKEGFSHQRGVILASVLFVLLLLGLLVGMFVFRVNADLSATQVVAFRLQARLAAEAGVEAAKMLLRAARTEVNRWYHNPDELHRIIVWAADVDPSVWGTNEELAEGTSAYRFSLVADDPTDDEQFVRFGLTDESAKVNLNTADEEQLLKLVRSAVGDDPELNAGEIVSAILDWRDKDQNAGGPSGDTEGPYYRSLEKPYRVKNGRFDTVEELLLVKGVTPAILYGEDYDRNGLLSPNEDDGDESFPPDNGDGQLNRGLYPYLTVFSKERDVAADNRPRIYLFGEENLVREQLLEVFEAEPGLVDYIVEVTRGQGRSAGSGADRLGQGQEAGGDQPPSGTGTDANTDTDASAATDKNETRRQRREGDPEDDPDADPTDEDPSAGTEPPSDETAGDTDGETDVPEEEEGEPESGDATGGPVPIRSPASLLLPRTIRGELREGPIGIEHLATLLDYTTTIPPGNEENLEGLINVNTAPPTVLRCIKELTEEQIQAIVDARRALDSETKATSAWLVTEDVVDLVTFERISPQITARGQQFAIESLGYADHMGMVVRLQVIVDMVGPVAQTIYYRDLTNLGGHYPIREEDQENIRVR